MTLRRKEKKLQKVTKETKGWEGKRLKRTQPTPSLRGRVKHPCLTLALAGKEWAKNPHLTLSLSPPI
jgi:hypothetical protein